MMQWGKEYCLSAASQLNLSYMQALFLSIGLLWIWENFSRFLGKKIQKPKQTKPFFGIRASQLHYKFNQF